MNRTQRAALMSSASPEWYTPGWLHARALAFLGGEVYDPCAPPADPSDAIIGLAGRTNGLAATWHGRVFLNPPYGRSISQWTRKALTEPIDEAVLLVPARTDTTWFQPLFDHTILFIRGRLYFAQQGREGGRATFPSALVYIGSRGETFAAAFADLGRIARCAPASRQPDLWEVTA